MIIPSIDIMGGKVVQLRCGRELVLTDSRHPAELAQLFGRYGPVAVVDLDAAMDRGKNRDLLAACCKIARCRVGGGVRTPDDVRYWIKRGAEKVVVGTMASAEFLRNLPREWLIVALDARGDEVVVQGWTQGTGRSLMDHARQLEPYCSEFLFTQVDREGMLGGCDFDRAQRLRAAVRIPVTVAGGIASITEISRLLDIGCQAQLGRALYEGRIDLTESWIAQVRFDERGLVPTIVTDHKTKDVLMLAYSNVESLKTTFRTGQGWYYSRSRNALWRKGATSGHVQELVTAAWDCDRDTLLFHVRQTGPACHTGRRTCFGDRDADALNHLERVIEARRNQSKPGSYTRELLDDPRRLDAKLREEVEEVISADSTANLTWECADVLYHLMVRMRIGEVTLNDVFNELRSRRS